MDDVFEEEGCLKKREGFTLWASCVERYSAL
jgi:hypothetical protein